MTESLEQLAHRAVCGNDGALEQVIAAIQDNVYGLALRMLGSEADARDCTQDILIRVVTRLSSFRGDSALMTWVYRIAANYLIDTKRRARETISFDDVEQLLRHPVHSDASAAPEPLLVEETFLGCTLAMLRCLDRPERLAFILGAILELNSTEAAAVLELSAPAFRKRLSRARARLESFMDTHCGIIDPAAPCRCAAQVRANVDRGLIDPQSLRLTRHRRDRDTARAHIRQVGEIIDAVELFRRHPTYRAPADIVPHLQDLVRSGRFDPLN